MRNMPLHDYHYCCYVDGDDENDDSSRDSSISGSIL